MRASASSSAWSSTTPGWSTRASAIAAAGVRASDSASSIAVVPDKGAGSAERMGRVDGRAALISRGAVGDGGQINSEKAVALLQSFGDPVTEFPVPGVGHTAVWLIDAPGPIEGAKERVLQDADGVVTMENLETCIARQGRELAALVPRPHAYANGSAGPPPRPRRARLRSPPLHPVAPNRGHARRSRSPPRPRSRVPLAYYGQRPVPHARATSPRSRIRSGRRTAGRNMRRGYARYDIRHMSCFTRRR